MLLKHNLERGVSKAELSRLFGVSRRTIHEWIQTGQLDRDLSTDGSRYTPRPPVAHKLDRYTAMIDASLKAFPGLSAKRLFEEVLAAGYSGGYTRVRDYVRAARPHPAVEPVVRFETPAGHQGQVDFATFNLPWGRRHALLVVLSYSRLLWLRFYRRQTMAVLTAGLEMANVRRHSTTGERPVDRFERDEREALRPLAHRPYPCLGVPVAAKPGSGRAPETVQVEHRSLRVYAEVVR